MKTYIHPLGLILIALALPLAGANADVNLLFNGSGTAGSPVGISIAPGSGSFSLSLQLQATAAEQITGIDYLLQDLNFGGTTHFFIMSRSTPTLFDSYVTSSNTTVTTRPGADLNSTNDSDLGAFTSDNTMSVSPASPTTVTTYTIGYENTTSGSQYSIRTTGNAAGGDAGDTTNRAFWSDSMANDFLQHNVNRDAFATITVVPEPATWSLMCLGGLGALGLNVLRRKRSR